MTHLTGWQIETMIANAANFIFFFVLLASMYALVVRGFTEYPWPEWATPRRFRKH